MHCHRKLASAFEPELFLKDINPEAFRMKPPIKIAVTNEVCSWEVHSGITHDSPFIGNT